MEGDSIQELSAIQMNVMSRQIVDVYHKHAKSDRTDFWSRLHLHGLSKLFLEEYGLPSEKALLEDFKKWLAGKDVLAMYANDPKMEEAILKLPIKDMGLPRWAERGFHPYHQTALAFKRNFIPILDKRCCKDAHSSFSSYPMKKHSKTELVKHEYGFHCSLYDSFELYLCYVTN